MQQAIETTTSDSDRQEQFNHTSTDNHVSQYPSILIRKCNIDNCAFSATQDEFLSHLITSHSNHLLQTFDQNVSIPSLDSDKHYNLTESSTNSIGRKARLDKTTKYYCGAKLNGSCQCCNGYCGPSDGCNCGPCMLLDVESRKLPIGYWVNREGAVCRKGKNGNIYCGRMEIYYNDYCEDENNCHACKIMQNTLDSRYFGVN